MPLVKGHYHLEDPLYKLLGRPANIVQSNLPARSNFWGTGVGTLVDQSSAATTKGLYVAIPVQEGDVISKVSVPIGATAGATIANTFGAVYSGLSKEGVLLGQSKTSTTATITASKLYEATLEKTIEVTTANAPNGYLYAGITIEGTTIPTMVGINVGTGAQYEWFTGKSPKAFCVEGTLKEAGVAEAKLSTTANAKMPLVFLS